MILFVGVFVCLVCVRSRCMLRVRSRLFVCVYVVVAFVCDCRVCACVRVCAYVCESVVVCVCV